MKLLLALVIALGLGPAGSIAETTLPKQVLVIYPSGTDGAPGTVAVNRALRSSFAENARERVEITNEYVDTLRLRDPVFRQALLSLLRQKYAGRKIDLIMPCLAPSLDFALECRTELFPGVPIVFIAVDEREVKARRVPPDVIGSPMRMDLVGTLNLALRLQPETRHVFVISGAAPFDVQWGTEARRAFEAHKDRVELVHLSALKMDDLLGRVGKLPERSVIFYLHIIQDGAGRRLVPAAVAADLAAAANAPVYCMVDTYVGRGVVGGRVFRFESCGRSAALLALRILGGERPEAIPTTKSQEATALFDWRQLQRWNIGEDRLPADSVFVNRETSIWDAYRWHIAGGITVCAIEALLIAGLFIQLRQRKRAESEREVFHRKVVSSQQVLAILSRRLLEAQELERRHIARELHDEIGQVLTTIKLQLELLRGGVDPASADRLVACLDAVDTVIEQARGISLNLRPPSLEVLGLENALRAYLDRQSVRAELAVELDSNLSGERLPPAQEIVCFRVAQESLTNTLRHGRARSFKVALSRIDGVVRITIRDDGEGFDVAAAERGILEGRGFGLLSMKERVQLVGGQLRIDSAPGRGTSIEVWFPSRAEETPTVVRT